jgi:hypothetical protein
MHYFSIKIVAKTFEASFVIFEKLTKVINRPIGKNLPNLVTVVLSDHCNDGLLKLD